MKKSFWMISIIVVLIIAIIFAYYHFINPICGWGSNYGDLGKLGVVSQSACDNSCISDSDCQPFVGSCININEKPYFPNRLSVAYSAVNCSCENQICVGKPTGELMI